MSMPNVEVITYGGGDLLRMVFNAIAMLFYGNSENGSITQPLCVITAMIGGVWGISRCFFQSYTDAFLTKYFLPLLALPAVLIVPQAKVHIIDKIDDRPIVVDHVPLLFAKIAGISSYWGYQITQAIENVMHIPNDVRYSHTGMIFGADTSLDFSRLKLNNATLAQNLHHFTQQCVVYDIALGRYTFDQLRKTSNLFGFLKTNTSKVRMIPYVDPESKQMNLLTCQESVDQMDPLFAKEATYYTSHEILKNLPIAYQALLSFQKSSEKEIGGQLANAYLGSSETLTKEMIIVNAFNDAASRFAVERAKTNQRSVYQTGGALAGTSLVTLRIVFEALIYACCVLILPLSLLPGGIKFIGSWIFLNIWIQLWPPLYGILNYITMFSAQKYANSILGDASSGFCLFTSAGFQDLAFDIASLGGYLSLSVPILSFYLLQNLQSIVHLAGPLLNPAQSAISSAAAELSSGNYSYANANLGQISYSNQTALQQNNAPTLSSGFFTDNFGTHQIKYGRDQITANQDTSNLNTSISTAQAYTSTLQQAQQNAQTRVDSTQALCTETLGIAERSAADMIQHMASSESFSNGYNTNETSAIQESANWVKNAAESWGHQHGLSARESMEYFASLGFEWPVIISGKTGHSENCNTLTDEARQQAENTFHSKDFQEHYQRVLNSTHSEAVNFMTDEGKRLVENYAASSERLKSTQEQYSSSKSNLDQISENLSFIQSNSSTVNTNLNTEFSNWLHAHGELETLFDKDRRQELDMLRDAFIAEKCQADIGGLSHFNDPNTPLTPMPDIANEGSVWKENIRHKGLANDLHFGHSENRGDSVMCQFESQAANVSNKLTLQQQEIGQLQQGLKDGFTQEKDELGFVRLNKRVGQNVQNCIDNSSIDFSWFDNYANPP